MILFSKSKQRIAFHRILKYMVDHKIWTQVNELSVQDLGPQSREIKAGNFQGFGLTSLIMQCDEKPEKGRGSDMK